MKHSFSKIAPLRLGKNRVIQNASWIVCCRLIQAVLSLVLTMFTTRYLGPSGYGLINYAASIVAFVTPVMQLGLNATLVQEILSDPEREGETLGTAMAMCFLSSCLCILSIAVFVSIANAGEVTTLIVCVLYSVLLLFQSIDIIQYWFQAKLLSKYTAVTMLAAYVVVTVYKIMLLLTGKSVYWFAVSQALDYCVISAVLVLIYRKIGTAKLRVSLRRAREMFQKSKYYIVSGLMVTIFAQTDRLMLKMMIDEAAVGYYSAAVTCAGMTGFVFCAIIDSARPSVLAGKRIAQEIFEKRLQLTYSIIIYLALLQSVFITLLAKWIVWILCGAEYGATVGVLRIIVWYTTFSYLGAVRNIWILAEEKQRFLWIINLSGALANVGLNLLFIPRWGMNGAAVASLMTQIFTNVMIGFIMPPIRGNNSIMLKSLDFRSVLAGLRGE